MFLFEASLSLLDISFPCPSGKLLQTLASCGQSLKSKLLIFPRLCCTHTNTQRWGRGRRERDIFKKRQNDWWWSRLLDSVQEEFFPDKIIIKGGFFQQKCSQSQSRFPWWGFQFESEASDPLIRDLEASLDLIKHWLLKKASRCFIWEQLSLQLLQLLPLLPFLIPGDVESHGLTGLVWTYHTGEQLEIDLV